MSAPPAAAELLEERARRLFPLRLTPFETYMFLDRREDGPIQFVIELRVRGEVDREALERAVGFAARRHPLTMATIGRDWLGRLVWTLEENRQPPVFWAEGEAIPPGWHVPPDLRSEAGVRVLVEQRGGEATLTVLFHHAVCDGVSSGQWIEDVLVAYAGLTGAELAAPRASELAPERLVGRRRPRRPAYRGWRWIRQCVWQLYEFFARIPSALRAPVRGGAHGEEPFLGLISHYFSAEESGKLRQATRAQGITLNDWLVHALFQAIADWNGDERNWWRSNPWYRINVPTSLRERADVTTPAANLVGMTFLNRRRTEIADPKRFCRQLARECAEIKRWRRGTIFLDTLAMVEAVPGLLRLILALPVCFSTAVLTNLGDPARRLTARFPLDDGRLVVGNLVVEAFGGVPTLRRLTHVAVAVNTYRERVTINLQMTPGIFSRADAEQFLRLLVAEIQSDLAAAGDLRG